MSTLEKVSGFQFLELFLIELVLTTSIEVMNPGHTLIINDKLFLVLHLVAERIIILFEWTEAIVISVISRHEVLVAHLLNCLVQSLHLFGAQMLLETGTVHELVSFIEDVF